MSKEKSIGEVLESHNELDLLRTRLNLANLIETVLKKCLPRPMKNNIEVIMPTPTRVTIFTKNQVIGAKLRQMLPSIVRNIQGEKVCETLETVEVKVSSPFDYKPRRSYRSIQHKQHTSLFIEKMKAHLPKDQSGDL